MKTPLGTVIAILALSLVACFFQKDKLFSFSDPIKLYDRDASRAAVLDALAKLAISLALKTSSSFTWRDTV